MPTLPALRAALAVLALGTDSRAQRGTGMQKSTSQAALQQAAAKPDARNAAHKVLDTPHQ